MWMSETFLKHQHSVRILTWKENFLRVLVDRISGDRVLLLFLSLFRAFHSARILLISRSDNSSFLLECLRHRNHFLHSQFLKFFCASTFFFLGPNKNPKFFLTFFIFNTLSIPLLTLLLPPIVITSQKW